MHNQETRIGYAVSLTKYLNKFHIPLVLSVLSNLIFKLLPLVIGLVTSYMIGAALVGDLGHIKTLFYTVGLLVVLDALFSYLDILISHDMAYRILTHLRDKAYDKIDEIAPAATEEKQSGDLVSVVLDDIELLEWFYAHTISQLIVAVIIPTFALIFMGSFSWLLPAILMPFIIGLICIPKMTSKVADQQGQVVRKESGILNAEIIDGVQGLKDIISFRWKDHYFKRFFGTTKRYNEAMIGYTKRSANENRIMSLIIEVSGLCSKIVIVFLALQGTIQVVWLMPLFLLSSALFAPIHEALAMSTNYGLIFGAAKRVFELFQIKPKVEDKGEKSLEMGEGMRVTFKEVEFTYPSQKEAIGNKKILEGISFSIQTGESVAIVGASGEGKTTIARLLQRFWDSDKGTILLNDVDIKEIPLSTLRDKITVVPQEVYLFNASVEENLRLAKSEATKEELEGAARKAQADGFIQKLPQGYETLLGERGLRLSGGEKQRLAIVQAFLKDAPVLVLDEASANLDSENERLINEAIWRLKKGRATMVIAHRISTIQNADRIIVLKDGKVEAEGTYEILMRTCDYFRKLIGKEYE